MIAVDAGYWVTAIGMDREANVITFYLVVGLGAHWTTEAEEATAMAHSNALACERELRAELPMLPTDPPMMPGFPKAVPVGEPPTHFTELSPALNRQLQVQRRPFRRRRSVSSEEAYAALERRGLG